MLDLPIIAYILIAIAVIALIFGAVLGYSSIKLKVESDPIVDQIDALYHKANAVNVATRAVSLMLRRLLMVM
ncbi:Ion-translocating oxidoreductase complex subunit B [Mannheimia haemolytica]